MTFKDYVQEDIDRWNNLTNTDRIVFVALFGLTFAGYVKFTIFAHTAAHNFGWKHFPMSRFKKK